MHMADALLSPVVGITLWAVSGAALAGSTRKLRAQDKDYLVPLMGVLGAFVFAAQMVNFTIPGTGSSGHIGGGLLLSILLGPHAALVVIASVLTVQALFFADGGLLALGANIFNLGVLPCFVGFLLIYRPLVKRAGASLGKRCAGAITMLAAVIGLQMGALGVVAQTQLSGISSLIPGTFLLMMQPIHLVIGLVEGLATAALVLFLQKARPDLFIEQSHAPAVEPNIAEFPSRLIVGLGLLAALTAGLLSWFASAQPDGLEWSIARSTGRAELPAGQSTVHARLAELQNRLVVLPDYKFDGGVKESPVPAQAWPAINRGTSLAGLIGGAVTLALVTVIAYLVRRGRQRAHLASRL